MDTYFVVCLNFGGIYRHKIIHPNFKREEGVVTFLCWKPSTCHMTSELSSLMLSESVPFFRAQWNKLFSLIPFAIMLCDECYWPLPLVLVKILSALVHDPAVSWSCAGPPHLGPIPLYPSHSPLATLQALSSPHTIICTLANSPVPVSSIKTTDWSHWLTKLDLWSRLSHQFLQAHTQ